MRVTLKLFGQLRHLADCDTLAIELDGGTVTDVLDAAAEQVGEEFRTIALDDSGALRPSLMVLLNDVPVDKAAPPAVSDGDTVTVLPAIAGG